MELAAIDQRLDDVHVAQAGEPEELHTAPIPQPPERFDDAAWSEHLVRGHAEAPGPPARGKTGVELDQVHRVPPEPRKPLLHVGRGRRGDVRQRVRLQADLGGNDHILPDLVQHAPEVRLRLALPVSAGRVEIVDAQ